MLTVATKTQCTLGFKKCRILCSVGVLEHEKKREQEIFISLSVEADLSRSFHHDSLEHTIDYLALLACCEETAKKKHYNLIENLAANILDALQERFSLHQAEILIEKPEALAQAECSFVLLKRTFAES